MMASDQLEYMEQESSNDEQNPNIIKIEKSDGRLEESNKDDEKKDAFHMPEHFLSANNTGMPLAVEHNTSIIKIEDNEESDLGSENNMDDADKEAFFMPEHFLSQTLTNRESNEGMDVNCVVGATAETLYTLTHTHDTGRKRVKYSCNVCEKDFKDKRDCIRHVRVHTGEKPYMCYQCGESFGRECYLSRHIKSHTGEKPFSCPICNKDFARKATLDQHLLTHTDMSERPFPCNQCESGFTKRSHLERHLKIHAQIRDFKCSMCDKDFLEKRGLIDHMKRLHSDRVLPSCKICNREFRWEHLLRRHMKAHTHNSSIEESEEQLMNSLPIFVSKDKKEIQTNTQNPSIKTSDSHSSFGNGLGVNDGLGIINNNVVSHNSDTVKASTLANSTNEELSSLNPQFFQSSVNDIGKTGTQINSPEMVYNSKEFNNLGRMLGKPTADSGMIHREHLTLHQNVLQPSARGTITNATDNELSILHPNFFQSSVQDIVKTGTRVEIPGQTSNDSQRNNPGTMGNSFGGSGTISKEQLAMYNNVLRSTDQSFGQLFPTWSQVPPK